MSAESQAGTAANVGGVTLNLEGIEAAGDPGREATVFRYRRPAEMKTKRGIAPLVRSDIMFSAVQVIREGGENSLHSHAAMDGFGRIVRRRRHLVKSDCAIALVEQCKVGERAADVDSDAIHASASSRQLAEGH